MIWYNEARTVMRDVGVLIFVILVPLGYPLVYAYMYNNEVVRDVPVAVVDNSHSAMSRKFLRMVDATPDVAIMAHCTNMAEAEELIKQQRTYGIINIPSSFDRDLSRGDQTHVGIYSDMGIMLNYRSLLLAASNVAQEMNRNIKVTRYLPGSTDREDAIIKMPIDYAYVQLFNTQGGFASFLIPPVLMLIIQQTLLLGIGMSMGDTRERFRGSVVPYNHYYKNPVHVVLGKALLYFPLYLFLATYMFFAVTGWFELPRLANYTTFLAFIVPYILACTFFALTLSMFIYRREDSIMIFVFMSVPLLFLSGVSWPGAAVPDFWKYISYIFPSTFGMNGFLRINDMGASLHEIAHEFNALWIQAGIYFAIAATMYRLRIPRTFPSTEE